MEDPWGFDVVDEFFHRDRLGAASSEMRSCLEAHMTWDQIGILLTGVIAVGLTQLGTVYWQRFACLFGLAGQPFWFAAAISAGQWGTFIVCCLYCVAWAIGLYKHWISPWYTRRYWRKRCNDIYADWYHGDVAAEDDLYRQQFMGSFDVDQVARRDFREDTQ
jgi:hypothetical protein